MHQCEEYASKGNIKNIKITLGQLIELNARRDKIGDLLRVSFQVQIKFLLARKNFNSAKNIIYSYIDIFGTDTEMKSLMKKYEAISNKSLAITQNDGEYISRDNWIHSKIINKSSKT